MKVDYQKRFLKDLAKIPSSTRKKRAFMENLMEKTTFVCLKDYVAELLKTAEYKKDKALDCVVAFVPALAGCMTQGDNFEDARTNLIDAIDLWITVGLREGEDMPTVNNCQLAVTFEQLESPVAEQEVYA